MIDDIKFEDIGKIIGRCRIHGTFVVIDGCGYPLCEYSHNCPANNVERGCVVMGNDLNELREIERRLKDSVTVLRGIIRRADKKSEEVV